MLEVIKGFIWDGPSGPTYDSPSSMRASLIHDVLYSLISKGVLPKDYRKAADREFRRIAIEDDMWRWRAWVWYYSLRVFGGFAVR